MDIMKTIAEHFCLRRGHGYVALWIWKCSAMVFMMSIYYGDYWRREKEKNWCLVRSAANFSRYSKWWCASYSKLLLFGYFSSRGLENLHEKAVKAVVASWVSDVSGYAGIVGGCMALGVLEKRRTAIYYVFNYVLQSPLKELWDDSASFWYPTWLKLSDSSSPFFWYS